MNNEQNIKSSDEKSNSSPSSGIGPAMTGKKRRSGRWLRVVLIILAAIILLVLAAPTLVSTGPGTRYVSELASSQSGQKIQITNLSLGWLGPCSVSGLDVKDGQGRNLATIGRIHLSEGLISLMRSEGRFGRIEVESGDVYVWMTEVEAKEKKKEEKPKPETGKKQEGKSVIDMAASLSGEIAVRQINVHMQKADGAKFEVNNIGGDVSLIPHDSWRAKLSLELPEKSPLNLDANIKYVITNGELDLARTQGSVTLKTDSPIDLGIVTKFFASGQPILGQASIDFKGDFTPDQFQSRLVCSLKKIENIPTGKLNVRPIDLNIIAETTATKPRIVSHLDVDGEAGQLKIAFDWRDRDQAIPAIENQQIIDAFVAGKPITLPRMTVESSGKINLAAIARAVPSLLKLREGLEIQSGELAINNIRIEAGTSPEVVGGIELKNLTAKSSGQVLQYQPIQVDFDISTKPEQGLWIRQVKYRSDFAQADASGSLSDMKISFNADLAPLRRQLNELFPMGDFDLSGKLAANVNVVRPDPQKIDLTATGKAETIKYAVKGKNWDCQTADFEFKGIFDMADNRLVRVTAQTARANIDNEVKLGGSGWYDLKQPGYQAQAAIDEIRLATLERWATGMGVPIVGEIKGTIRGQAQVSQAIATDPILSSGKTAIQGLNIDGHFIGDPTKDVQLEWSGFEMQPTKNQVKLAVLQFASTLANLNAKDVSASWPGVTATASASAATKKTDTTTITAQTPVVSTSAIKKTETAMAADSPSEFAVSGHADFSADLDSITVLMRAFKELDTIPGLHGAFSWVGDAKTTGHIASFAGSGSLKNFKVDGTAGGFKEDQITFDHDTRIDQSAQKIDIKKMSIQSSSGLLKAEMAGTVEQYAGPCVLNLSGKYEAGWDQLMALIKQFKPDAIEAISLSGSSKSDFKISGPIRSVAASAGSTAGDKKTAGAAAATVAKTPPASTTDSKVESGAKPAQASPMAAMTANIGLGWDKAKVYGTDLGKAVFAISMASSKLDVPETKIPADPGAANIRCLIDMNTAEPTLVIDKKLQVLDKYKVTPDMAKQLLSRINPIFTDMAAAEGQINLSVESVNMPLGESMKKTGAGKGRLDLSQMKVQPSGLLKQLLELGGIYSENTTPMVVDGCDFRLADGRIYYENFTVKFGETFDLMFYGSVGFDETVDLTVSVPVKQPLLEKFGINGKTAEYAKMLEGMRVPIPVMGSRNKPKVDWSKVDMKTILGKAIEKMIKEKGIQSLEQLLPSNTQSQSQQGQTGDTNSSQSQKSGVVNLLNELISTQQQGQKSQTQTPTQNQTQTQTQQTPAATPPAASDQTEPNRRSHGSQRHENR